MPIEGKLGSLYVDKEQTQPLFPRTKTKAITDDNNIRLDITLDSLKTTVNSKASEAFVMNAIANAQLGGGEGDIDLSGYATKDDIAELATKEELALLNNAIPTTPGDIGAEVGGAANSALNSAKTYVNEQISAIDYPVDSINGKTGAVQLSASDVGALSTSGGKITGALQVGDNIVLSSSTEGGNVHLKTYNSKNNVDYWEIDPNAGNTLRIFAYKNANNANGQGHSFALNVHDDGSISVGSPAKTRTNLGAAPAGYGLGGGSYQLTSANNLNTIRENGWYSWGSSSKPTNTPTGDSTTYLDVMRVTGTGSACIQEVFDVSNSSNCGLKMQRIIYGSSYVSAWEWVNPPMTLGVEYRTTERWGGKPVYVKLVNFGTMPNNTQKSISVSTTGVTQVIYAEGIARHSAGVTHVPLGGHLAVAVVTEVFSTNIALTLQASTDFSAWSAMVLLKYVK